MTNQQFESDVVETSVGDLEMTFLGHGTLMFTCADVVIHIDPYSRVANYGELPKADLVLITHQHGDHLDPDALGQIRSDATKVLANEAAAKQVDGAVTMHNGDRMTVGEVTVEAVPAYNVVHKRGSGQPFHPKGEGNGYVLTFGDTKVYVAGDTENIPEMQDLTGIDVAFLPMNLPYTMTPEMAADAARGLEPDVVYPYHYGDTDTARLEGLLADTGIEVRVRDLA
jgi:L-ascorbate metabolism protein UlaG (beta-lactamase superfamily)